MIRTWALIAAIVLVGVGVAGFFPLLLTDYKLFGLFRTDSTLNIIHILSGVAFILALQQKQWALGVFRAAAIAYSVLTIAGFLAGSGRLVLGIFYTNTAQNLFHLLLACIFLYIGFSVAAAPASVEHAKTAHPGA